MPSAAAAVQSCSPPRAAIHRPQARNREPVPARIRNLSSKGGMLQFHNHRHLHGAENRYALVLIAEPAAEPLSLEEVRQHLRIPEEEDDGLLLAYLMAARRYFEDHDNRRLCTQTWELRLQHFPASGIIEIPLRPLQVINSVKYINASGVETTVADTEYQVDADSFMPRLAPAPGKLWPLPLFGIFNPISINFDVGYDDVEGGIPQHLKQALLLLIGHFYENREDTTVTVLTSIPKGYDALIGAGRRVQI